LSPAIQANQFHCRQWRKLNDMSRYVAVLRNAVAGNPDDGVKRPMANDMKCEWLPTFSLPGYVYPFGKQSVLQANF
jgi:hypothetical protein